MLGQHVLPDYQGRGHRGRWGSLRGFRGCCSSGPDRLDVLIAEGDGAAAASRGGGRLEKGDTALDLAGHVLDLGLAKGALVLGTDLGMEEEKYDWCLFVRTAEFYVLQKRRWGGKSYFVSCK